VHLDELRRWHAIILGRETRILEIKREVNELLAGAGKPPRYPSAETTTAREEGRGISNVQHGMSNDEGKSRRGISNVQHGMSNDEGRRKMNTHYPMSNVRSRGGPENSTGFQRAKGRTFDLQDRFVEYAVRIIRLSDALPETRAGRHICSQALRSGTSPAAHYGEAQSAESRDDFVHKLKVALKELRETGIWLKIIARAELITPPEQVDSLVKETDVLISILFKSVDTAMKNKERT